MNAATCAAKAALKTARRLWFRREFRNGAKRLGVVRPILIVAVTLLPIRAIDSSAAANGSADPVSATSFNGAIYAGVQTDPALAGDTTSSNSLVAVSAASSSTPVAETSTGAVPGAVVLGSINPTPIVNGFGLIVAGLCLISWDCVSHMVTGTLQLIGDVALCVGTFDGGACKEALSKAVGLLVYPFMAGLSMIAQMVIKTINKAAQAGAQKSAEFLLVNVLSSKNTVQNPAADCRGPYGSLSAACNGQQGKSDWFVRQYGFMAQIGLLLIAPFFLLLIIQSVIKGSLFFLVRATTIMLPLAILGTVLAVSMTQLLLNVSQDISNMISASVTDVGAYGTNLSQSIQGMDADKFGMFALIWLIVFIAAAVVIMIELLLRQTGIYLALFFLPIGFAGLVWPSASKWITRLIQLLLGLIFSQIFIQFALVLGITAIGAASTPSTPQNGAQQATYANGTEKGTATLQAAGAITITAAFAGGKIMAYTPAAEAASQKLANPGALWSKGILAANAAGLVNGRLGKSAGKAKVNPRKTGL